MGLTSNCTAHTTLALLTTREHSTRRMKKLRLGLIGLGSAGLVQYHAAKSVRNIEFVASAESGEVRERVDIPVHKDWRRLLEDVSIDAVSIALPHHLHLEV